MDRNFIVTLARFHRHDGHVYVLQGYFEGNSIAGSRLEAVLGSEKLEADITVRDGLSIRQKYFARGLGYEDIDREYDFWIRLPEGYEKHPGNVLKVYQIREDKKKRIFRATVRSLLSARRQPDGYLETFHNDGARVSVGGWAVGNSPCRIQVVDSAGIKLRSTVTWHYRQDIISNYPELEAEEDPALQSFGFEVTFDTPPTSKVRLIVAADGQKQIYPIDLDRGEKSLTGHSASPWRKLTAYYKRNGLRRTLRRIREKLREKKTGSPENYMNWRRHAQPSREELEAQSRNVFLKQPLISIVVPLYRTPETFLRDLVASVERQTYRNWQLCLSDGSGEDSPLTGFLAELRKQDSRIVITGSDRQLGIAENTNKAIALAEGDFIAFADHDDLLPPNALYECVKLVNEDPNADLIYSDEDKVSFDGKEFFEPHFKTDFNIDLLCSMNYFCHLVVMRRDLLEKTGGLDPDYDGAQDYDLVLRAAETASGIRHIPKVLYHWRSHKDSTAENPESKMYAFEAGRRAVQAHYDRIGVDASVEMGTYPGLYRTVYKIPDPAPLVSVIIPNKDHVEDLSRCIDSLLTQSSYPNLEIIIVENNSEQESTFDYYRQLESQHEQIHVTVWDGIFNYSEINNYALNTAKGEYLLFLNNDTAFIGDSVIEELLGPCLRSDVGVVGARMYYADNTIQHAGVIIGYGGIAGHAFQGMPRSANGYFSRIICQSDLSAVTAACMMVKRSLFEELNGFDGLLKVAFNDIDFCLRVRETGKLVVYNPYAQLYHYESRSRGQEDSPGKIARFNSEADEFMKRWPDILKNGDPYYNPNLSLDSNDFRLRRW